jgi:hypothetical protein
MHLIFVERTPFSGLRSKVFGDTFPYFGEIGSFLGSLFLGLLEGTVDVSSSRKRREKEGRIEDSQPFQEGT